MDDNYLVTEMNHYYTWIDETYRNFMLQLISYLEPKREAKHTILINELDEFNMVEFVHKGKIVVGYEINK